jgi:hypothetical protein
MVYPTIPAGIMLDMSKDKFQTYIDIPDIIIHSSRLGAGIKVNILKSLILLGC